MYQSTDQHLAIAFEIAQVTFLVTGTILLGYVLYVGIWGENNLGTSLGLISAAGSILTSTSVVLGLIGSKIVRRVRKSSP